MTYVTGARRNFSARHRRMHEPDFVPTAQILPSWEGSKGGVLASSYHWVGAHIGHLVVALGNWSDRVRGSWYHCRREA
jgi:hypothetical protein